MAQDQLAFDWIHQVLMEDLPYIFRCMSDIATYRIYRQGAARTVVQGRGQTVKGRTGTLQNSLQNPSFKVWKGAGNHARMDWPVYIRFLDMKKHGNYKIYNRQLYGIFYGRSIGRMRYEFRKEVRDHIQRDLARTMAALDAARGTT